MSARCARPGCGKPPDDVIHKWGDGHAFVQPPAEVSEPVHKKPASEGWCPCGDPGCNGYPVKAARQPAQGDPPRFRGMSLEFTRWWNDSGIPASHATFEAARAAWLAAAQCGEIEVERLAQCMAEQTWAESQSDAHWYEVEEQVRANWIESARLVVAAYKARKGAGEEGEP